MPVHKSMKTMQQSTTKNLILIIDDNLEELRFLGELIKDQGDVIVANSGETGLFLAAQRKPDLIIAALQTSDLSGIDVCKRVKFMRETKGSAVIVVSSCESEACELAALEAGAVDFIGKPFSPPVVKARVKTHLSLSRHQTLLQHLADRDGLTKVFNRRYFEAQAKVELKRHYRQQQPMTLALLDIDHFKPFNDHYGHLHGDTCLRQVAQAISNGSRRPAEFVARYGGEEFVAVLPSTDVANANKYGRWICERVVSLAVPHAESTTVPFVSVSAGIATVTPDSTTTLDTLIAAADTALYQAKQAGRNQHKVAITQNQEDVREVS